MSADGNVLFTTGGEHAISGDWASMRNYWRPGELFKLNAADGAVLWTDPFAYSTTPPITGRNGLVFVGATMVSTLGRSQLLAEGKVKAYHSDGSLAWSTTTRYMPQDLFAGNDGNVYVVGGDGATGEIYVMDQLTGLLKLTITGVPAPLEIMLKDGVIYAVGESAVTAITLPPGFAFNYDWEWSSWPVRQHDNQRTSAK